MEQEVFKDMLRKKGLKVTNQRMLVLEIMAERPGEHLTAEDIYDLAKKKCPEIGLATICLLYTSPSPRDYAASRMPSSA